jgi:hypothetical protein
MVSRLCSIVVVYGLLCSVWTTAPAAEPQDLSFASLRDILLRENPSSVAAAIEAIQQRFPSYLSHHTLAYHSPSLHGADYENPRAIVFGNTAEFIITFNGNPKYRGYGSIEVMEFSPTRGYAFRAISFLQEPNNATDVIDADEIELKNVNWQVSKPNPGICTSCHDKINPRPIWEPFAIWPGIYGSADDRLFRFLFDSEGQPRQMKLSSAPNLAGPDTEKDGFNRYLANRPQHPRYKLLPLPQGLDVPGFEHQPTPDAERRPNLALTKQLSIQAAKLIARDASAEPNATRKLVLLAATECVRGNPTGAVPAALKQFIAGATAWQQTFERDIAGMMARDLNRMQEYFEGNLRLTVETEFVQSQASLQPYLLAAALDQIGMKLQNYSFNTNRVNSYQDGANGLFALGYILRKSLQGRLQLDHIPSCAEVYNALESEQ